MTVRPIPIHGTHDTYILAYREKLKFVGQSKDAEEFKSRHGGPQVLIVCRHRVVGDIVVRSNTTKFCALEPTRGALVLDQVTLFQ